MFSTVNKRVGDDEYTFNVPAYEGSAEEIAERYGIENVVKAYTAAKFPGQTVAKMLADGKSADDVQAWLDDWTPGSRSRLSPADRLLQQAEALGMYDKVKALLAQERAAA